MAFSFSPSNMKQEHPPEAFLRRMIVTIDGPAGSGKSTTASILARRLELRYLDTGAMYRAVTYAAIRRGVDPEDADAVSAVARSIHLEVRTVDGNPVLFLEGEDIEKAIRSPAVSDAVSAVSRHGGVRREMVHLQRSTAMGGGVVAEGRDTGSVVFPHADVKIFLIAGLGERAARRRGQLNEMGIHQDIEEIKENISMRDEIDSSRAHSPLVKPAGAITVDTSTLTVEQQVSVIERHVRGEAERMAHLAVWQGESNPYEKMRTYYRFSRTMVRVFFRLFFGLRIIGEDNLRFRENFIFASNHISYFDPPVVGCALKREVSFVAKKELFKNRLLAWLIRRYHAIPVDRNEIDKTTMKRILKKLTGGESILMFPEGTRSRNGGLGRFKTGLGFLSLQSRVSVVPVHVVGTAAMRDCFLRRRKLEVRIGAPIRVGIGHEPNDKRRDYETLSAMVRNSMEMLKHEAEA